MKFKSNARAQSYGSHLVLSTNWLIQTYSDSQTVPWLSRIMLDQPSGVQVLLANLHLLRAHPCTWMAVAKSQKPLTSQSADSIWQYVTVMSQRDVSIVMSNNVRCQTGTLLHLVQSRLCTCETQSGSSPGHGGAYVPLPISAKTLQDTSKSSRISCDFKCIGPEQSELRQSLYQLILLASFMWKFQNGICKW